MRERTRCFTSRCRAASQFNLSLVSTSAHEQRLIDLASQSRLVAPSVAQIHLPERQNLADGVASVVLKRLVG
jgi:hypothetical protein